MSNAQKIREALQKAATPEVGQLVSMEVPELGKDDAGEALKVFYYPHMTVEDADALAPHVAPDGRARPSMAVAMMVRLWRDSDGVRIYTGMQDQNVKMLLSMPKNLAEALVDRMAIEVEADPK